MSLMKVWSVLRAGQRLQFSMPDSSASSRYSMSISSRVSMCSETKEMGTTTRFFTPCSPSSGRTSSVYGLNHCEVQRMCGVRLRSSRSFLPPLLRTHLNRPNPTLITQMNRDILRQRLPYPLDAVLNLRLVRVPIVDVTLRNAVGAEEDVLLRAEFFELR